MTKYFCPSIEDCVFGADGLCTYCDRKEPRKVTPKKTEKDRYDFDESDEPAEIISPKELF